MPAADYNVAKSDGRPVRKIKSSMNKAERYTIPIVVTLFCVSISLMCISVATDYWYTATVYRADDNATVVGSVNGGLFYGQRAIDDDQGERVVSVYTGTASHPPLHAFDCSVH